MTNKVYVRMSNIINICMFNERIDSLNCQFAKTDPDIYLLYTNAYTHSP